MIGHIAGAIMKTGNDETSAGMSGRKYEEVMHMAVSLHSLNIR